MGDVIDVRDLVKRFGKFVALDGLALSVSRGEVAGFLGPNGSGKSTTIRILLGLLRHDEGTVRVFGADPHRDAVAVHHRLAYVPGDVNLWPHMTGGECIDLLLSLRGKRTVAERTRAELIERFALDPSKRAEAYSKGNRQKVALIAALCADTELLVLDEPTSGLDPLMTREFTLAVRERAAQGAAVLMSSHLLSEVEELCSTVTIIRDGRTVLAGPLAQLRHLRRSHVQVSGTGLTPGSLAGVAGVHDLTADGADLAFTVDAEHLGEVLSRLAALNPTGLAIEPPSLEELFLQTYGVGKQAS